MILADIGNRHIHIYEDGSIVHLDIDDAIAHFSRQRVYYICVNSQAEKKIDRLSSWIDISRDIYIDGEYEGMGVDRKALCLSRGDGVYIDAGSAITVDKVIGGRYMGGLIFLGLYAYKEAYSKISERLDIDIDSFDAKDIVRVQKGTINQIKYTILKPIIDSVNDLRANSNLPVYITGGDRVLFANILRDAQISDGFVFEGMMKVLEKR